MKRTINIKESHLKLIKGLVWTWDEHDYGCPKLDTARPFGSPNIYFDMARLLDIELPDIETQFEKYTKLTDSLDKGYKELGDCLRILSQTLSLECGTYELDDDNIWRKVNA